MKAFNSAEHQSLDEDLKLKGLPSNRLLLPNGLDLKFGDIITLSGDYFAVAKKPICFGKDEKDRRERFLNAYAKLAYAKRSKVTNILETIQDQKNAIDTAMQAGKSEAEGVKKDRFRELFKILFFADCNILGVFERALDHMEDNALIAHHAGHQLAMEAAASAYSMEDEKLKLKKLSYAYTLEAFACHFLTDHFAAGHLRVPSAALYFAFGPTKSTILSTAMHDEDNYHGLHVTNARGDKWKAYGDDHLFESYGEETRRLTKEALKIVVNDVFEAFNTGKVPSRQYTEAYQLVPKATDDNFSPMFKNDLSTNVLLHRVKLDDIHCHDYKELTKTDVLKIILQLTGKTLKEQLKSKKVKKESALKNHAIFKSNEAKEVALSNKMDTLAKTNANTI